MSQIQLKLLNQLFAISRLEPSAPIPDWAYAGSFHSITRTADELSIVGPQANVPEDVECEKDWRCLGVVGVLDFSMIGVLATLTALLADAEISVFSISTYNADYLLVKDDTLAMSIAALEQGGYEVVRDTANA